MKEKTPFLTSNAFNNELKIRFGSRSGAAAMAIPLVFRGLGFPFSLFHGMDRVDGL